MKHVSRRSFLVGASALAAPIALLPASFKAVAQSGAFVDAAGTYGVTPGNTPAVNAQQYQAAINDAVFSFRTLLAAPGSITISQPLTIPYGLNIQGTGIIAGSGWGSAIQSAGDFPAIIARTNDPITMRDMSILMPAGSNSACIDVDGVGGNTNYYSVFERLRLTGGMGIFLRKTSNFTVRTVLAYGCKLHAVRISQAGDSVIDDLIANGVEGNNPAVFCDGTGNWGGLRLVNSKLIGGGYGFHGVWGDFADGVLQITNNSIEGMTQSAILIQRGGAYTGRFGTVLIANNVDLQAQTRGIQIPTDPGNNPAVGPWLNDVLIGNNPIFAPLAAVDIDSVGRGKFVGNTISGAQYGVIIAGQCRDWVVDTSRCDGQHVLIGQNIKQYGIQQVTP